MPRGVRAPDAPGVETSVEEVAEWKEKVTKASKSGGTGARRATSASSGRGARSGAPSRLAKDDEAEEGEDEGPGGSAPVPASETRARSGGGAAANVMLNDRVMLASGEVLDLSAVPVALREQLTGFIQPVRRPAESAKGKGKGRAEEQTEEAGPSTRTSARVKRTRVDPATPPGPSRGRGPRQT